MAIWSHFMVLDAISEGLFEIAGKIVAHSVLHGCDGFVGLSPAVVKYNETGSVTKAEQFVTTEDLPDNELRNIIESKVGYFKKLHNINYVHVPNLVSFWNKKVGWCFLFFHLFVWFGDTKITYNKICKLQCVT